MPQIKTMTLDKKHAAPRRSVTLRQTVEVPASYRLTIDVPREFPLGKAVVSVTPLAEKSKTAISLLSLRGSCKGLDTMEAYFERKRADKVLEYRKDGLV